MTAAFFSFRNEVTEYYRELGNPISVESGTNILSGSLDNLLTRQLHRGVTILNPSDFQSEIQVLVRGPQSYPPSPPPDNRGRAEVRVVAVLGLERPSFSNSLAHYIHLHGYDTTLSAWIPLASKPVWPLPHETSTDPTNVILTAPWDDGETGRFRAYRIGFQFSSFDGDPIPATFGGIWIGNAVELSDGVDSQWVLGIADAGSLSITRGGQAYARPAPSRRTLRATFGSMDERTAFGIGLFRDYWGRELASNYLSDAAKYLGATGPCIMVPRVKPADVPSGDKDWIQRTAIYGHLTRPIEITHRGGPNFTSSIEMIEEF